MQVLTIPEGAEIDVRLDDFISASRTRSGNRFEATLVRPIELPDGALAVASGAKPTGTVAYATGKQNVALPTETRLHFFLQEPVTINRAG